MEDPPEEVSERPMVVARGFETDANGQVQTVKKSSERTELLSSVLHTKLLSTAPSRSFDQGFMA
ncbi:MAG: hypothetical protein WAR24_04380, partial [Candidatus Acidiferrales bacterium]